jgi:hypothetical protein
MSTPRNQSRGRAREAVRRLLRAIDQALAAAREVEAARAALDQAAHPSNELRLVPKPTEEPDER